MYGTLALIVYHKLKHLHQLHWRICEIYNKGPMSDTEARHIAVVVPSRNAMYVWYDYCNQLQAISLDDEDNITTYQDYDFKLFIKTMKKILKLKSFNLNYER